MIVPFSFFKDAGSDTTSDGKQAFLVIGDSTSAGANNNTGQSTPPTAGTAYYYDRTTMSVLPMTADIVAAPAGSQYPTFCTNYYNDTNSAGAARKAVIIPTGVSGSTASNNGSDPSWATTGTLYALSKTDVSKTLLALGLTRLKAIFITSIGINDASSSVTLPQVQSDINSLISRLQADYPGVPILIESIGRNMLGQSTQRITTIRGHLRSACENNSNCYLINGMLSLAGAGVAGADIVHPNQTGNEYRGAMLARWFLNSNYSKWARSIISSHFDELSTTRKNAIATLIDSNLSDYLQHDTLILFKTTNVNNTCFDWGFISSPTNNGSTFVANSYISTNGSSTYLSSASVKDRTLKSTQNDGFSAIKVKTNVTGANASRLTAVSANDGIQAIGIHQESTGLSYRYNDLTFSLYTGETSIANNAEYLTGRSSTNKYLYKNGTQVSTVSQASIGLCTTVEYIGAANNAGSPIQFLSMTFEYYRSGKFSTVNQSTFKAAMDTFLAAW